MRFDDDEIDVGQVSRGLLRRLSGYLWPYRGRFLIAFVLLAGSLAVDMVVPWLTGLAIDTAVDDGPRPDRMSTIAWIAWGLLVGKVLQLILSFFGEVLSTRVGQDAIRDLRLQIFRHMMVKPMALYQRHPVGRLVMRVSFDLENIAQMYTTGVVNFLIDMVILVGFAIVMILQDRRLGLAAVACLPLFVLATVVFRRVSRPIYLDERRSMAKINAFLAENIAGVREVKLFAAEGRQMNRMRELVAEHLAKTLQMLRVSSLYMPGMGALTFLVQIAILVYASVLASRGELTLGTFVAFIFYLEHFFRPIREVGEKITVIQIAAASAERIFQLLDDDEALDDSRERHTGRARGEVVFDDVTFGYESGVPILKNVTFTVSPGERIALVGPTGAGKTSVLKVLQRFWDVQEGSVRLDGIDIREWRRDALRRSCGSVQQDVHLFSGTIADNISLGRDDVLRARIEQAAEAVCAAEFIERLPDGYDNDVLEGGRALSAGQRQLVSFARIFAADPSILLLDEATSSIDTESEQRIQEALDTLMADRTCFIIAHRLSTVRSCDRIFVIEAGRLVEEGSHDDLVARGGVYAGLVRTQAEEH